MHVNVNNRVKIAYCSFLIMLLPVIVRGQHNEVFGNDSLRGVAVEAAEKMPAMLVVYDFLERYLNLLQGMTASEQASRMERDDVAILQGGIENLSKINGGSSLAFAEENNRYRMAIFNGSAPLIEISLPASCQLLTGKSLKELEQNMLVGLDNYSFRVVDTLSPSSDEVKHLRDNYYLRPGEVYQIDEINNNLYFEKIEGRLQLLFDADNPLESSHNLLLSEMCPADVSIELTIRKYGLKKECRTIPLKLWLSYLKTLGCKIYIGVEELSTATIRIAFFAVNNIFKYNHVMNVEVPYRIFKDGKGVITADLTPFVPTHNISALFDEFNQILGE